MLQKPERVKNTIKFFYDEYPNLEFAILFGGGEIIKPFKGDWYNSYMAEIDVAEYYTDHYFACMDDEDYEDEDEEGRDYTADLIIGRFPANNIEDIKIMIDKCIEYEMNPPIHDSSYFNNTTLFAEFDGGPLSYNGRNYIYKDNSNFIYSTERIIDGMINHSYNYTANLNRIYFATPPNQTASWYFFDGSLIPSSLHPSNFNWYITKDRIIDLINNGTYLLSFRGHGNVGLWSHLYFGNDDISALTNCDKLPVGFAITCLSGVFYNPTNKTSNEKSLCESFLTHPMGGCAAMIGANSESWPYYNEYLYAGLFEAIYPGAMIDFTVPYQSSPLSPFQYNYFEPRMYQAETEIGKILNVAGERMFEVCGYDTYSRMNRETFHCLGDPTLKVYRFKPNTKPPKVTKSGDVITITDSERTLVASAKNGGNVFLPQKTGDSWEVQNYIDNYDLSLVSDNRLYDRNFIPYFIDTEMLISGNINNSKIDNISTLNNKLCINYTADSVNVDFLLYDIYGQQINKSKGLNGYSSIDCPSGIKIIVMEVDGEIIERKIVY